MLCISVCSIEFSLSWDYCPSFTFLWYIHVHCCFWNLKAHIQKVDHYNTISHQSIIIYLWYYSRHVLLSLDRNQSLPLVHESSSCSQKEQSGGELSCPSDQSKAQNCDDINCKWSPVLWGHCVDKWHCAVLAEFLSRSFLQICSFWEPNIPSALLTSIWSVWMADLCKLRTGCSQKRNHCVSF